MSGSPKPAGGTGGTAPFCPYRTEPTRNASVSNGKGGGTTPVARERSVAGLPYRGAVPAVGLGCPSRADVPAPPLPAAWDFYT